MHARYTRLSASGLLLLKTASAEFTISPCHPNLHLSTKRMARSFVCTCTILFIVFPSWPACMH
ncbi:hypothetical protein BJX65DRAFT_270340 [Aspergillus insuetus]